jgi:hypothetical protein
VASTRETPERRTTAPSWRSKHGNQNAISRISVADPELGELR